MSYMAHYKKRAQDAVGVDTFYRSFAKTIYSIPFECDMPTEHTCTVDDSNLEDIPSFVNSFIIGFLNKKK